MNQDFYISCPLSTVSKIIEKLIHKKFHIFLEQEILFYNLQFGFHVNCATNNALVSIIENIQTHLDNSKYIGVFVDLKRAFETVDHDILIKNLIHNSSYMKVKKQFVMIKNENSTNQEILTGTPLA